MRSDRDIALHIVDRFLGTPYRWGGDDPSGFDCSGLVIEALQSAGCLPRGADLTAEGLRARFPEVAEGAVQPGDLVFWLRPDGSAYHVAMLIDPPTFYIGADGGGSKTKTLADAWAGNAYVKIRPVASRPGPIAFGAPLYEDSLGPVAPDDGG